MKRIGAIYTIRQIHMGTKHELIFQATKAFGWLWSPQVGILKDEDALLGAWQALAEKRKKELDGAIHYV